MLDTVFDKQYLSQLPKGRLKARSKSLMKTWSYVGRFIWGFAKVEYQVNQLFQELFGSGHSHQTVGVGYAAGLMLTYSLDLRKKLEVIDLVLKSRGIDEGKTFKRVHALHDLRNVMAHWPFEEEADESGLFCDFISKHGDVSFAKPGTHAKDSLVKYAEFDSYDAEASIIYEKLDELLESAVPVSEFNGDLQEAIETAISSSENVVRFPKKPGTEN